jgi:predicted nucleic acid-binding protein
VIILDTNVISALMRREVESAVLDWIDGLPDQSLWTTAVSVFEVRFGLELLPPGRRRRSLEEEFAQVLDEDLEGRVLSLDIAAADRAASAAARHRRGGRTFEIRDAQIAGIALAQKATLATRNTRHFSGIGLALVDPWAVPQQGR